MQWWLKSLGERISVTVVAQVFNYISITHTHTYSTVFFIGQDAVPWRTKIAVTLHCISFQ